MCPLRLFTAGIRLAYGSRASGQTHFLSDREAEGARLLSEYAPKGHPGFESLLLRHLTTQTPCAIERRGSFHFRRSWDTGHAPAPRGYRAKCGAIGQNVPAPIIHCRHSVGIWKPGLWPDPLFGLSFKKCVLLDYLPAITHADKHAVSVNEHLLNVSKLG